MAAEQIFQIFPAGIFFFFFQISSSLELIHWIQVALQVESLPQR